MHNSTQRKMNAAIATAVLAVLIPAMSAAFAAPPAAPAVPVVVDQVKLAPNAVNRRYAGRVSAIDHVACVSRVSGELVGQGFEQGAVVKKDQLLFKIDDVRYQAAVQAAEAKVSQIKSQLEYAESDCRRKEGLYKQKAVSLDSLESIRAQVNTLKAQLQAASAELVLAQDDLKNCRITSPIDGKSGKATYAPGNYITPASGTLVTVTQLDPIRVRFSISQRDFLALFGSEKNLVELAVVKVKLADGITLEETGVIDIVDNQTLNSTDAIRVWAKFANPRHRLIPNAAVSVHLTKRDAEKLPAVIPSAVMHDRKGAYVYVVGDDNAISRRDVVLGETDGDTQMILQGLSVGEKVVVEGMHKVRPGSTVVPVAYQAEK